MVSYDVHCTAMYILWVGVSFLIIFTGRHLRLLTVFWFPIHLILGIAIFILTIVLASGVSGGGNNSVTVTNPTTGAVTRVKTGNGSDDGSVKDFHTTAGPIIFVIVAILIVNGILLRVQRKYFFMAAWIQHTRVVHMLLGYLVILLSLIVCHTGQYLKLSADSEDTKQNWYCLIMYPGYALLFIFAEIMVKKMAVWSPVTQKKDYTYEEVQREARGGRSLFVIENKVCDLTKYMLHHPGKQLLDEYVGTEIGRYVYGGFPSKDRRVQFHTPEAFSIMQDQCCGTVRPILDLGVAPNSAWRIANRQSASKVHYIIQFASPPNKLPAILPGINFCGTYIKLKSRKLGVTRNYSWSFLNSRSVMKDHLELVKRVDDPGFTPPFPRISGVTKERIEICVKKQRLMSKWLQDKASDSDEFEIEGPFGAGMQMDPGLAGTVVGIALGTAIVPFLDLIGYLLRMNVFKSTGKSLFGDEQFDFCGNPAFKFVLFFSVRTIDEALGVELCKKLQEICVKKGINNFELHLRDSASGQQRWNKDYFAEKLGSTTVKRVYIASVAGTEASFAQQMREVGVPDDVITIL